MQSTVQPLKLNEANVNEIFAACMVTNKTNKVTSVTLFSKLFGYPEDSKPVHFDSEQLEKFDLEISYLFGQLKKVHQKAASMVAKEVPFLYTDKIWSRSTEMFMKFLYLGAALQDITPFRAKDGITLLLVDRPTLAPDDPNFSTWWEAHQAEWERG